MLVKRFLNKPYSMKKIIFGFVIILLIANQSHAQENFIKVAINGSVEETVKKITAVLESKGLTIFSVIDHQKGAEVASMKLLPNTLIIFGNPAVGTKLMACDPRVGIDLPLKYLVYEDKKGNTWVAYSKPALLTEKYTLNDCLPILEKLDGALAKFVLLAQE